GLAIGVHDDLRLHGRLVRSGHTGKLGDLARTRLLVVSLGVAALAFLQRAVDEDFDELAVAHDTPRLVAIGALRGDEGRHIDHAGMCEELGNLADAPDVLIAVRGREAQVLVQAMTHIVAIQHVGVHAALPQRLFERYGERRFARSRQASHPDRAGFVTAYRFTVALGHHSRVPDDMPG